MKNIDAITDVLRPAPPLSDLVADGVDTVLLIDFDGVLNPRLWRTFKKIYHSTDMSLRYPNPTYNPLDRESGPKRYEIRASSELVGSLSELAEDDAIQIVWLTTWREHMGGVSRSLGLTSSREQFYLPWGGDDSGSYDYYDHFQKIKGAVSWLNEAGLNNGGGDDSDIRVAWVDDVLFDRTNRETREIADSLESVYDPILIAIGPDADYGISRGDLEEISDFLS